VGNNATLDHSLHGQWRQQSCNAQAQAQDRLTGKRKNNTTAQTAHKTQNTNDFLTPPQPVTPNYQTKQNFKTGKLPGNLQMGDKKTCTAGMCDQGMPVSVGWTFKRHILNQMAY
jgi:hypothetical protein